MRVEFSPEVLEQPAAFRHLTAIAWMFTDGRHTWVVRDSKAIARSAWLVSEGEVRRRILAEDARTTRSEGPIDLYVRALGMSSCWRNGRWEVPAETGEQVLREPLSVVVENAQCDGAYLRFIALRTGEKTLRRRLGDAVFERLRARWVNPLGDNVWFAVRHGAGSTTGQQVQLLIDAEPTAARRLYVLVDSDRSGPKDPLGLTASGVEQVCQRLRAERGSSLRLSLRILHKREVENYLPPDVLRAHSSRGYERWCQLSEEGKDYEDLKELFGKNRQEPQEGVDRRASPKSLPRASAPRARGSRRSGARRDRRRVDRAPVR